MPTYFDTHCHYNLSPLSERWRQHWLAARAHGVTHALVVGTTVESSKTAVAIARAADNLYASVGIHPSEYQTLVHDWLTVAEPQDWELESVVAHEKEQLALLIHHNRDFIRAIGESGLDYFHLPKNGRERTIAIALQNEAFSMHLDLAAEYQLPLSIHARDTGESAYFDILELIKQWQQQRDALLPPLILHCLSGPKSYVEQALKLGAYVGIAGNVTYRSSEWLRELISIIPPERILAETDAPYLPPADHRGQTCEPWMISETATYVEEALGVSRERLYQNALQFFTIK